VQPPICIRGIILKTIYNKKNKVYARESARGEINMRNGKTELVNKIVEVAGREGIKITKKDTAQLLKTLQTSVEELLQDAGDTVDLQGFVKFEKYETPEREFYNIATKTVETSVPSIKIKAKSKLKA
jgi:nucleoid DNA-binding protein